MKEDKYSVFVDNKQVAQHMSIEGAITRLLCEKRYKEEVTTIIIAREPVGVDSNAE